MMPAPDEIKANSSVTQLIKATGFVKTDSPIIPFVNTISLLFDGLDLRVDIPDDASLSFERTDPFSISHWIKFTSHLGLQIFSSKRAVNFTGWIPHVFNGQLIFILRGSSGGQIQIRSTNSITDTNWHNVVFTYDGSSTAAGTETYIDSILEVKSVVQDALTTSILNNGDFKMGVDGDNSFPFNGNQDEVSVWKKKLTSDDIIEIYNVGSPDDLLTHSANADLVLWHRFDGSVFPASDDSSLLGNNGVVINGIAADYVIDTP